MTHKNKHKIHFKINPQKFQAVSCIKITLMGSLSVPKEIRVVDFPNNVEEGIRYFLSSINITFISDTTMINLLFNYIKCHVVRCTNTFISLKQTVWHWSLVKIIFIINHFIWFLNLSSTTWRVSWGESGIISDKAVPFSYPQLY